MDLSLEEAVARILAALPAAVAEGVPLPQAHGRVLAQPLVANCDLPPFDNSAMDGYAVRAEDVASATQAAPVRLRVLAKIAAGQTFAGSVTTGACVRLFTGSPLPAGADAVVMQEDTSVESGKDAEVMILDAAKPWENVRLRGGDVKRGETVAQRGEVLTAGRMSLLAAGGNTEVQVGRRPIVGLLATGSELRDAGESLAPGQIYDSNRITLGELVRQAGGIPKLFPLVPDTSGATRAALIDAFDGCDAVVSSGGVSVGEMDFVKEAFEESGGALEFWRVSIRPGRPFVFGRREEKFLFGLPGNPVSAFVTFLLLVRPALLRWHGATDVALPTHPGVLAEALANPGGRRHFVRVRADISGKVYSAGVQASHALSSLATANGLVDIPPQTTLPAGAAVTVLRWGC